MISSNTEIRVELVESLDTLNQHAEKYDALAEEMDGTCFPAYQRSWIEQGAPVYLAGRLSLFFLLAWRNDALIGVAPLQMYQRSFGLGTMKMLTFWGQQSDVYSLKSLTGDFIIPNEDDRVPCLTAFRKYLTGEGRKRWDVITLNRFCSVSRQLDAFKACFPEATASMENMPGFMVEFPDNWDALAGIFKGKTVKNLRRSMRLLKENSDSHEFVVYEEIDDRLLEDLAKVHTSRQQELLAKGRQDRDAPFASEGIRQIIGNLLKASSRGHKLRIYCLYIDKQLAAFNIVLANQHDTVCWLIAFDGKFQQLSPSRLLFQYMYATEMERFETRRMNLLVGFTRTKEELSTVTYSSWSYVLTNNYWVGSTIKRTLYNTLKNSAHALLRLARRPVPNN